MGQISKDLSYLIDGTATVFQVSPPRYVSMSTKVVFNGLALAPGIDAIEDSSLEIITLSFSPQVGDTLIIFYDQTELEQATTVDDSNNSATIEEAEAAGSRTF